MSPDVSLAVKMMFIALPVMFAVILVFIGATRLLHKTFPYKEEDED